MRTAATDVAQPLVEPLTRRESQMLALLAAGYSRPEIAAHLTLALSSVKFHLHHLYAKLGVSTKRQALSRATALGLLAPPPRVDLPAGPTGRVAAPVPKHNLPMPVTRFFGREAELAQLRERLGENRLVTLTGPGGVGKSRLSLRTAEELLPGFTNGVWLVELAPLSDPSLVAQQVASSLGLRDAPGRPPLETLTAFLRDRQVLLVLDNCEHLLAACAELVSTVLSTCPRVRLLVSSREPLGIGGEALFIVPSLAYPDPDHLPPVDRLTDYPAISLFLDRARLVLPDYRVAAHNVAAVARICQRLDGLPLALEMAASRLRTLSTEELAARLDDAFHVLAGGGRGALPRHQTLRATIDWSYALLTPEERRLFQRLAVFAGGCTLAAAEAICIDEAPDDGRTVTRNGIVACLAALVEKSLVVVERRPGEATRYRLLEIMRQYAHEKLDVAGETARLRRRHCDYYGAFVGTSLNKTYSGSKVVWSPSLVAERDNLRQALEWSFSDVVNGEIGLQLLVWSMMFMFTWFPHDEMVDWFKRGVAWCESRADISDSVRARFLAAASGPASLNYPQTGLLWQSQAVDVSRRLGPEGREVLMDALLDLARFHLDLYRDVERAQAALAEAQAIYQELGPDAFAPDVLPVTLACFACQESELANVQGHYQAAQQHANASIRHFEASHYPWGSVGARISLGTACLNLGQYEQAQDHFNRTLALIEEVEASQDYRKAYVIRCLGVVAFRQGALGRALDCCRDSLREAMLRPDYNLVARSLGLATGIAARQGQAARAAQLCGAAEALYARQGRPPWDDFSLDTLLPGWRDRPDGAALTEAFEAGRAMTPEQAVALALSEPVG